MRTKVALFLNLNCETKQIKTKTWHMQNKNPMIFYCKEIKTWQGYDKRTYPKLVLNILKIIENSTFIYTY
jgi:hypothetical protein